MRDLPSGITSVRQTAPLWQATVIAPPASDTTVPAGAADGSTKLFDVQTHGEIIEAGQKVKVESVQEGHIWVPAGQLAGHPDGCLRG